VTTAAPGAAPRIEPSILAGDFANIEAELQRIATADAVHVDVMDNHFVPNLSFGPQMVERIQATSPVPLDVHLMIDDPDRWAPGYAELGAFSVTFHAEAAADVVGLARRIRQVGSRAGVALKPGTAVEPFLELLPEFDQVLVMTVEPGFGGQSFMPEPLPKLHALREAIARHGVDVWLQVDGGITVDTIGRAAEAGADTFVAGSSVYGRDDAAAAIADLRAAAARHAHA
jgi:ribulose-phosphate 3-epimerase